MDGAVSVNVKAWWQSAAVRLGFQDSMQRCRRVLSQEKPWLQATIVGNDHVSAILVQDLDRKLIEQVTILLEHERFGTFLQYRCSWKHDDVLHLFDRSQDSHSLARPESPNNVRTPFLFVDPRLVDERNKEFEGPTIGVSRV